MVKYIYLAEEEIKREESLFAPHEAEYAPLEERSDDIRSHTPPTTDGDDVLQILGSC